MSTGTVEAPQSVLAVEEEQQAKTLAQKVMGVLEITTPEQYVEIAEAGKTAATLEGKITNFFKDMKDPAYRTWRAICDREGTVLRPVIEVKQHASRLLGVYSRKQEEERKKKEAELQDQHRKAEEDSRLNEAARLERDGRKSEAEQMLNSPSAGPAPVVVPKSTPLVSGVSKARIRYKCRVLDVQKLVNAIAAGNVPLMAIEPNMKFLNEQANSFKEMFQYPGCEAYPDGGVSFKKT